MNHSDVISAEIDATPIDEVRVARYLALRQEPGGLRDDDQVRIFE